MRDGLVIDFAKEIVRAACEKGMTIEEMKCSFGWAISASCRRVEELPVELEDLERIAREPEEENGGDP